MKIELSSLLFDAAKKLTLAAVRSKVDTAAEPFLLRRKIEGKIDDSVAQVVESLLPFLENEGIVSADQILLIETCTLELNAIISNPQNIFAASLDGQKLFDLTYPEGQIPECVNNHLKDIYAKLFPQIANLVCAYPAAIEAWKVQNYREGFKRLDEIATTLSQMANKLDMLGTSSSSYADELLHRVRQSLAQRVEFQLDLTGLRGDRPDAVPIERLFIAPELAEMREEIDNLGEEVRISSEDEIKDAITSRERTLITGAPGAGKSTLSLWIQRLLLFKTTAQLAILVKLREVIQEANELPSHLDLLKRAAGPHLRESVENRSLEDWCDKKLVTFIFDGFDEIPPLQRDRTISWIKDLPYAAPGIRIILTSRPLTTNHIDALKGWSRWRISPFDEARIVSYINRWYENAPLIADKSRSVDANALAAKWISDPVLEPLAGSPLMLATLLMVHHIDGELPRGRAKVYERYIDGMLGLWDSRWGIPSSISLSPAVKKKILTRLAVNFHLGEFDQVETARLTAILQEITTELCCGYSPLEIADYLRERTGLVVGPGTWSFVHKSVGEFLVAQAIIDGDWRSGNGDKLDRLRLFQERHNDRWNTVLFFWAGLASPGDLQHFIESIQKLNAKEEFPLAVGLIKDQIENHRLPQQWRENSILALAHTGLPPDMDKVSLTYVCNFSFGEWRPHSTFPVIGIRSLQPEPETSAEAIWECIQSTQLRWHQFSNADKSVIDAIWFHFLLEARDIEELESVLSAPRTDTREILATLALAWRLSAFRLGSQTVTPEQLLSGVTRAYSNIGTLYPLLILATLVCSQRERRGNPSYHTQLITLFLQFKTNDVSSTHLADTRKFCSFHEDQQSDLLAEAAQLLAAPNVLGIEERLAIEACNHIHKLISIRDQQGLAE